MFVNLFVKLAVVFQFVLMRDYNISLLTSCMALVVGPRALLTDHSVI